MNLDQKIRDKIEEKMEREIDIRKDIEIRAIDKLELELGLNLYQLMYPEYSKQELLSHLAEMMENSVKFIASFSEKKKIVAIAGYWIGMRLHSGKYLQIDSLFVHPDFRGQEVGSLMLDYLKNLAKEINCNHFVLDVFVTNHKALKLYVAKDFQLKAYHLMKKL